MIFEEKTTTPADDILDQMNTYVQQPAPEYYTSYIVGADAVISQYADYISVSNILVNSAIDAEIEQAANTLAYRIGITTIE